MTLAYALCSFGGFAGIVVIMLGLVVGIKARLKLDKPVNRTLTIISDNFLLAGGITTLSFLTLSLFLL